LTHAKISVLLVEDHVLVRRGLRRVLEDEPEICVVGEAGDGLEAVQMACDLKPHIVLMDFALPRMNGVEATKKIVASCDGTAVIMLSMHTESVRVRQALDAGARGYVFKSAQDMDLISEIRRVASDAPAGVQPAPVQPKTEAEQREIPLTAREIEILRMVARGDSNKEIAEHLSLSVHTVTAHRSNMMRTLGMHKTAELVAYAVANGLIDLL
jgi:DNA-binding NarL/FixJ family response regulator